MQKTKKHILSLRARNAELDADLLARITSLWNDPAIKEVIDHHAEHLSITHLPYFFDNIDRIKADNYKPTDIDILRCRQRTSGASSTTVFIDKNYFEFFDIGGQKPERAKWEVVLNEHSFASVIYFVASDEFDVEDEDKEYQRTKLEISRLVFSEIVNSNMIANDVPIILFINRKDLFTDRFKAEEGYKQFLATFPDYAGGNDEVAGLEFIRDLFLRSINDPSQSNIKHHFTCALDTESMVVVWRSVREKLLKNALSEIGFDM